MTRPSEWVDAYGVVKYGKWSNEADPSDINEIIDGTLYDYLSSADAAYRCPIAEQVLTPLKPSKKRVGTEYVRTYSKNAYAGDPSWLAIPGDFYDRNGLVPLFRKSTEEITGGASEYMVFAEENDFRIPGYGGAAYNDGILSVIVDKLNRDNLASFHNTGGDLTRGKANVSFADGHVTVRSYREPEPEVLNFPNGVSGLYTATMRLCYDGVPID